VHLAVVDPGVGTARAALAFGTAGHWFVGPDNGLFTAPLRDAEVEIVAIPVPTGAAPTFHGRDLFAPVAAALASATPLRRLGEPFRGLPERLTYQEPHYEGKSIVGEIVYVDRFGTLVTNLTPELVPPYASLEIEGLDIGSLRRTYGDVPTGGVLAYIGSGGAVEVAVRDGSAARRLGIGVGGRVRARLG
jgi:S-adenosylmethionine hydrolase